MKSVSEDDGTVERDLGGGRLRCPGCSGRLRPWGWARPRSVRTLAGTARVRPRRTRCVRCSRTHVLLPDWLLLRRADTVEVIGAALVAHTRPAGYRQIARAIGRPPTTVRDWLRRWGGPVRALAARLGGAVGSAYAAGWAVHAVLRNTNPPRSTPSGPTAARPSERRTEVR